MDTKTLTTLHRDLKLCVENYDALLAQARTILTPEVLRAARVQCEVSGVEMARRLNTTPPHIHNIERGYQKCPPNFLVAYLDLYMRARTERTLKP